MADYLLHHDIWGFVLFFYGVMALVTLPIAISTLALETKFYNDNCATGAVVCYDKTFYVGLPGIAVAASIISFAQAIYSLWAFHYRRLVGLWYPAMNAFNAALWLIVMAIGWANTSTSITTWLLFYKSLYKAWIDIYGANTVPTLLAFAEGLVILSCFMFAVNVLITAVSLVIAVMFRQSKLPVESREKVVAMI